jgi:hypothetical protein
MEVYQDIWVSNLPPHLGRKRMLLGDMVDLVSERFEPGDQFRFSGSTRTYHSDLNNIIIHLSAVPQLPLRSFEFKRKSISLSCEVYQAAF